MWGEWNVAKKQLKKQVEGPKKQHSRNFREELFEFLDDVKRGIEDGDEWEREFNHPNEPDDESEQGLAELFNRSGLDITAPGHWQFLLVAVLNAYGENWTRVFTDWTEGEKNRFLWAVLEQRSEGEKAGRLMLCQRLIQKQPKDYRMDGESLRVQLQNILKEKRDRAANETATDEDIKLLKQFDG